MNFSFHHLTLEPEKIIKSLMHKEQRVVEEYGLAIGFEKAMIEAINKKDVLPNLSFSTMSELGNVPVQVVVKKWKNIISVYPITITSYQEENVPWLANKHDSRKSSITQKNGSIIVCWEAELIRIGFLLRGEVISEFEMSIEAALVGSEEYTLQRCAPKDMILAILNSDVAKQSGGLNLDIPLMLPSAWKEVWLSCKKSQLITICE